MQAKLNVLKFLLIAGLMVLLYSFSNHRNRLRSVHDVEIYFTNDGKPLITLDAVNKLLIQNEDSITSMHKETLVLNEMEQRLRNNPMVRDAQVFVTIDGQLGARIEQRNPIARVAASPHFYLDDQGKEMPLSEVYSARVPLITGSSETNYRELTELLNRIQADPFMNQSVIGLHCHKDGDVDLRIRKHDFLVRFGLPVDIDRKFQNFKAFYKKTNNDKTLTSYRQVNLEFGSQVVAVKK